MNSASMFLVILSTFEGAMMLLLPHYSPRRYFFAITVAPEFLTTEIARRSLRRYHWSVAASVILAALASSFPLAPVLPILIGFAAFLRERSVVRRYAAPLPAVREAALSPEGDHLPGWFALALLPFAVPLTAAAFLRAHWEEIPARFPVHWGANGEPNRWVDKSVQAVYGPLLFSAAIMLVILLLTITMYYGARRGPQRTGVLKLMVGVTYVMALVFSGTALLPILKVPLVVFLIPAPVFVIIALVWSFRMVRTQSAEETADECWHLGSFYYNPQDAAVFVQKRIGFGYTFNFGNRLTWVILGSLMAVFAGLVFLLPK